MAATSKPWFAAKRHGYGAGFPIAWEGWAVLLVFIGGLALAVTRLTFPWSLAAAIALVAVLILVASRKTEGGWRWRRGENL